MIPHFDLIFEFFNALLLLLLLLLSRRLMIRENTPLSFVCVSVCSFARICVCGRVINAIKKVNKNQKPEYALHLCTYRNVDRRILCIRPRIYSIMICECE